MWASSQQLRLALEKKILERRLPQFQFHDPKGGTYVSGVAPLPSAVLDLTLKCVVPRSYPDEMPRLFVTWPVILWKYNHCGTVNSEGTSHAFHTLWNGPGGVVQICHFKPEQWHSGRSLLGVLVKGLWWARAYEEHLRTGKPLCDYCG
jgi:hypothetical protein